MYYDGYGYDHLGFKDKFPIGPRSGIYAIDIATRNGEGSCLEALQEAIQPARQHAALTADVERVRSDEAIQPARQHAALTADVERVRNDTYNASIVETSMRQF